MLLWVYAGQVQRRVRRIVTDHRSHPPGQQTVCTAPLREEVQSSQGWNKETYGQLLPESCESISPC